MKILHVCSNYFPAHGGPQYVVKHLSEKLVELYNDEVTVITSNSYFGPEQKVFKKIKTKEEIINGVKVVRYPIVRWHYELIDFANKVFRKLFKKPLPHSIRKYRWEMHSPSLLKAIKNADADVIMVTTSSYMFSDYPLWRQQTALPKAFVQYGALHLHIPWAQNSPVINRAKICDFYVANTGYEKNCLIEKYKVDANKIIDIGIGIDENDMMCDEKKVFEFRQSIGLKDDDILIGHIGRLSEGKGTKILLDAFQELSKENKNVYLLLAGTETDYVRVLEKQIKEHNLPVKLLINFNDDYKPVLFNALDVFVLASSGESFGIVFLEAWACKKPVIGTKLGAIESVISENQDGLLFESKNAHSLYQKLNMLVTDKALRETFGSAGYNKIKEIYSWNIIVEKFRKVYGLAIKNFKEKN